jgi:hypothetical protein
MNYHMGSKKIIAAPIVIERVRYQRTSLWQSLKKQRASSGLLSMSSSRKNLSTKPISKLILRRCFYLK